MLNRVFKTILILSLCLGMTLPVNAGNVGVSDGSAFITKSEMSYQLNTLSQRMAQLENSLDSRIDKLVSSYLTRNGIWNGVKQSLAGSTVTDTSIAELVTKDFSQSNDWQYKYYVGAEVKASKTGLLYYNYTIDYRANDESKRNIFWEYYEPNGTQYDNDIALNGVWCLVDGFSTKNIIKTFSLVKLASSWAPNNGYRWLYCSKQTNAGVFFVNKDDLVCFFARFGALPAYRGLWHVDTSAYNPRKVIVEFIDVSIY